MLHHEAAAAGGNNDEQEEYKESESLHREDVGVGRVDISLNLTQKFWCLHFESWHNTHFFTFW